MVSYIASLRTGVHPLSGAVGTIVPYQTPSNDVRNNRGSGGYYEGSGGGYNNGYNGDNNGGYNGAYNSGYSGTYNGGHNNGYRRPWQPDQREKVKKMWNWMSGEMEERERVRKEKEEVAKKEEDAKKAKELEEKRLAEAKDKEDFKASIGQMVEGQMRRVCEDLLGKKVGEGVRLIATPTEEVQRRIKNKTQKNLTQDEHKKKDEEIARLKQASRGTCVIYTRSAPLANAINNAQLVKGTLMKKRDMKNQTMKMMRTTEDARTDYRALVRLTNLPLLVEKCAKMRRYRKTCQSMLGVLVAASYLEGSAARWLSGLVQLQRYGHDFRAWAVTQKLDDFLKLVEERWHDPQESQRAIDAILTLHTRQFKSVREATDAVERLICVPGVRYDPQVLLTSYLRCFSLPLRNQLAGEASINMHNFPSFNKKALDLEAKIGHGNAPTTDGRRKSLPPNWKAKGRIMFVDNDGSTIELDDNFQEGIDTEAGSAEASEGGVVAAVAQKGKATDRRRGGSRSRSQVDPNAPPWEKVGLTEDVWRDRYTRQACIRCGQYGHNQFKCRNKKVTEKIPPTTGQALGSSHPVGSNVASSSGNAPGNTSGQ
ncbi:hypothetical protein CBR_g49827 [Chara braunii]|uniref:CCHC-type domain-containing protein n=1 Tax=Chara braunii TaxID=69332 RepID=A0A388JP61_CHABU|nr:hypothetical protein CBR_g49827 [Chara braunii]|eukprot:GBG59567.1 hypothetical protein CBR_g49827 [Chara braunii]